MEDSIKELEMNILALWKTLSLQASKMVAATRKPSTNIHTMAYKSGGHQLHLLWRAPD